MKVIDLLNKIANGEEIPKKIRIDHWCYKFEWKDYAGNYVDEHEDIDLMSALSCDKEELNYGVEILEEEKKIPEKINNGYTKQSIEDMKEARFNSNDMAKICNTIGWLMENRNELSNKIDEIIDYLD